MQLQTQVATGRGKQNNCPTTWQQLGLYWSWPRFSVYTAAAHLQPGSLLLPQFPGKFPGLEALGTSAHFQASLAQPCPKARSSSSSALSPSWKLPEDGPSSIHRETWSGAWRTRLLVSICLPEQDLQSSVWRWLGAGNQWGVFRLAEPTVLA